MDTLLCASHNLGGFFFRIAFDIHKAVCFTLLVCTAGYNFPHSPDIGREPIVRVCKGIRVCKFLMAVGCISAVIVTFKLVK